MSDAVQCAPKMHFLLSCVLSFQGGRRWIYAKFTPTAATALAVVKLSQPMHTFLFYIRYQMLESFLLF